MLALKMNFVPGVACGVLKDVRIIPSGTNKGGDKDEERNER